MKNSKLFLIFLFLCFLVISYGSISGQEDPDQRIKPTPVTHTQTDAFSPITITLNPPPPGKLGIADMWKATIMNTGDVPLRVYFYGTLTENKAGLIATAVTIDIEVKKGITILKASDFPIQPNVSYPNGDPKYKDALIKTGNVPPGEYTYCVYVFMNSTNEQLAYQCLDVTVEDLNMISLINPANEDNLDPKVPVVFSWMSSKPPKDATYKIRIVEIIGNQSPEAAFSKNNAWFEQSNIRTTMLQYPKTAKKFEIGKKYAWGIVSGQIQSEINTFNVGEILLGTTMTYELTSSSPCCFRMKFNTDGTYSQIRITANNISSATAETGYSILNQMFPNSFDIKPTSTTDFPRNSTYYIASICFSTPGTHQISVSGSSNFGTSWGPLYTSTVNCDEVPTCNCPTGTPPGLVIATFGTQTAHLECDGDYVFHPNLTNPATVSFHLPDIVCDPSTCNASYSYSIYRVLPSFENQQNGTVQDFNYTFNANSYGTYIFQYTVKCGSNVCYSCIDSLILSDCECNKLNGTNNVSVTPEGLSPVTVSNNQSFPHNYADPTLNFIFPQWLCSPVGTPPDYTWYIYDVSNPINPIAQGTGYTFPYDFTTNGNYLIKYFIKCCGNDCDSIKIFINRAASSDCNCSTNWGSSFQVDYIDNIGQNKTITNNCNASSTPLIYNVGRNTTMTYKLNMPYNCVGFGTTDCPGYYYRVNYHPSEVEYIPLTQTTTATTTGIQFQTPPDGGYYCFEIYLKCGIVNCDTCRFNFSVVDTCPCNTNRWNTSLNIENSDGNQTFNTGCFPTNPIGPIINYPPNQTYAHVSFTGYPCLPNPPCTTLYKWKLTDLTLNTEINSSSYFAATNLDFPIPMDNPTHQYRFVVYVVCDCFTQKLCDSCGFEFTVKAGDVICINPQPTVGVSQTLTMKEHQTDPTFMWKVRNCGNPNPISAILNKTYYIYYNFSNLECNPSIQPTIKYTVTKPSYGTYTNTMYNNENFPYNFTEIGNYTIKFEIYCGTVFCNSCTYTVKVTDGCGCGPVLMGHSFQVFQYISLGVIITDTVNVSRIDTSVINRDGYWDSVNCSSTIDLRNATNTNVILRFDNIGGCTIPIGSVCPLSKIVTVREYNYLGMQAGQYNLPLTPDNKITYNFNSTSHNYILTFYKYCGTVLCKECRIIIRRTNGLLPALPVEIKRL